MNNLERSTIAGTQDTGRRKTKLKISSTENSLDDQHRPLQKKERCIQVLAKGIHFLFLSFAVLLISFYYTE
jgi:hypothetical protein